MTFRFSFEDWCLGHLAGLAPADAYDPAYSKWDLAGLPILSGEWKYTLSPEKRRQFDVLAALMAREDVESLVCATNALQPGADYDRLFDAALCRTKADWLVVEREDKIAHFKKEKFYTVELDCGGFKASGGQLQDCKEAGPAAGDLRRADGNRIFGYTAQQVLDYAQTLYEKKLLTYPQTGAQFLTEDTAPTVPGLVEAAAHALPCLEGAELTVNVAQAVDGSKVSNHHALLPTGKLTDERFKILSDGYEQEQGILEEEIRQLQADIHEADSKTVIITSFLKAFKKYTDFEELTPGMLQDLIEKIVIHAPDKSSGHRRQQVDIYYTFVGELATSHEVVERKRKAAWQFTPSRCIS